MACRYPPRQVGESPWAADGMDAEESDSSDGHGSSYFSGEPIGTSEAGDALSSRSPSGTLDALLPAGSAEAAAALHTQLPPWLARHSTGTSVSLPVLHQPDGPRTGPGGKLFRTLSDQHRPRAGMHAEPNSHHVQAAGSDPTSPSTEPLRAPQISLPASSPFAPAAQVPVQTPPRHRPQEPVLENDTLGSPVGGGGGSAEHGHESPTADGPWTGADDHSSPSLGSAPADSPDNLLPGTLYGRGREVSIGPSLANRVADMMASSASAAADRDAASTVSEGGVEAQSGDLAASPGLAIRVQPGAPQGRRTSLEAGMGSAPLPDSPLQSACSPASRGSSRRSLSGDAGGHRSRLNARSVIGKMAGALNFGHRSPTLDPLTTNNGSTDSPVADEPR